MGEAKENFTKTFSKIQSVLPSCIKKCEIKPLLDCFNNKISESNKLLIETAVRDYVIRKLVCKANTNLEDITTISKICIGAARNEVCLPTLPVLILIDAFDTLTITQCEKLFEFVESNVAVWKEELFFAVCKNHVLRMCNDVLRRLSRSQNTIFCGRILLFLARFFPFSERSGLNLISEFNLENVTSYANYESDMDLDTSTNIILETSNSNSLDYTLYAKFWALQDFFRNPSQCYQKEPWKIFIAYVSDVLEAFLSYKLDSISSDDSIQTLDVTSDEQIDQYFAKYLTSPKLLDLQFSDSNFRRYILLQLLILMQYLTSEVKFKIESLNEEQTKWISDITEKVYQLLNETPPDGPKFVEATKHLLQRENKWNDWKNNGCPKIVAPSSLPSTLKKDSAANAGSEAKAEKIRKKRKLGDIIQEADSKKQFIMGSNEMTKLWNLCPDNLEACKKQERDYIPSLETYFMPAIEQIFGKANAKQDKLVNNGNFGWRALRLLACRSPHFFTHSTTSIATLPEYLTTMIKKIAKELPNPPSEEEAKLDEEDEEEKMQVLAQNEKEENQENEEEESRDERPDPHIITENERKSLATNLAKLGNEKWKSLAKKLGFEKDEIEYMETDRNVEECISYMFQLWVENEGEEAHKEALLYILSGLQMSDVLEGVF